MAYPPRFRSAAEGMGTINVSRGLDRRRDSAARRPAEDPALPERPGSAGWKVDPAPDGRGAPPQDKPPLVPRNGRFLAFLLGLLALNLALSFMTGDPPSREKVPYQPLFVDQLEVGNVKEITSTTRSPRARSPTSRT